MSYKKDPTLTSTLRKKAVSEVNKRFSAIQTLVTKTIVENEVFKNIQPDNRGRYIYKRDAEKVGLFLDWLNQAIAEIIMQGLSSPTTEQQLTFWLFKFIAEGYRRGHVRSKADIERITKRFEDKFGTSVLPAQLNAQHIAKMELLATRTFNGMKGITEAMTGQIAKELTDGVLAGKNPNVIAKSINERIDAIGKVRSRLIARTEIINAFNTASVENYRQATGVIGEPVLAEWVATLDGRERETHRARNGNIYKLNEAQALLGEPNCRCALAPWIESVNG